MSHELLKRPKEGKSMPKSVKKAINNSETPKEKKPNKASEEILCLADVAKLVLELSVEHNKHMSDIPQWMHKRCKKHIDCMLDIDNRLKELNSNIVSSLNSK